jgi:hypothetical protein
LPAPPFTKRRAAFGARPTKQVRQVFVGKFNPAESDPEAGRFVQSVESDNGQSTLPGVHSGANSAGAQGPMQFEPATFAEYDLSSLLATSG